MAITIILAQNSPVRCDRTLDTDSASDSSDSWFHSRTAEASEVGSTHSGSRTSTLTRMATEGNTAKVAAPVASEADFDVDNQETKLEKAQTDKADVAEDSKKDEAVVANEATKGKAGDATGHNKDKAVVASGATDHDKDKAAVADDDTKDKDEDDQNWGNWNKKSWNWKNQGGWQQQEGQLLKGAKQRLNKAMKDLCRPVHCEALSYVLPDRSKKACLTWRSAIHHCVKKTGKTPQWAEYFLEC